MSDVSSALVTITLPYHTMNRILRAITSESYRLVKRQDNVGVQDLSVASEVIGDAIGAASNRRFRLPEKYYHAVLVGDENEFDRWLRETRDLPENPVYVDSVETAKSMSYSGYTQCGTAYRRPDFQELVAAVRSRTFERT